MKRTNSRLTLLGYRVEETYEKEKNERKNSISMMNIFVPALFFLPRLAWMVLPIPGQNAGCMQKVMQ
jgi:hypothetical protein